MGKGYYGVKVKLSDHFTFEELTATSQTALQGVNRTEAMRHLPTLTSLATDLLEPIRTHFGKPLIVHSGFRGPALNTAIGGSKTSQHMKGEACDFHIEGVSLQDTFDWIKKHSGLKWGQLIKEPGWIHISLGSPWRPVSLCGQTLSFDGKTYHPA